MRCHATTNEKGHRCIAETTGGSPYCSKHTPPEKTLEAIRDQARELLKDKERLDWLQENGVDWKPEEGGDTIREAIDFFMGDPS